MPTDDTGEVLKNIDQRLQNVEQILPTLATKDELNAAVSQLATKEELRAAVAQLATKEELNAAVVQLTAKAEEEGDRSRRYMKILNEEIKATVKVYAEHLVALDARDAHQQGETLKRHVALERRVTALEAKRSRRRG